MQHYFRLSISLIIWMPLLQGGCILRDVINNSATANITIRGVEAVPGSIAVGKKQPGAKVRHRSKGGKARRVTFNQPTGDRMKFVVREQGAQGETCRNYLLQVDEENHQVKLLKRESCVSHFGYDEWGNSQRLPELCYVDLELGQDVNSLELKVVPYDEVKMMLQDSKKPANAVKQPAIKKNGTP
jgi:hypothetical protein